MTAPRPVVEPNTWDFLREPMIAPTGFREYDARWKYPDDINLPGVTALGLGLGTQMFERGLRPEIAIGNDYRDYSLAIKNALILGLLQAGVTVKDIGPALSPMAYFSQFLLDAPAVAMVTASHNPNGWTGVKMGFERPLTHGPEDMARLRDIVLAGAGVARDGGRYDRIDGVRAAYIDDLVGDFRMSRPLRVVCATGNGTAGAFAPEVLERIGVEVIPSHNRLDYTFPNYNPNPEALEMLHDMAETVGRHGADLALGFDGDGDRCGVVDNEGEEIFADKMGVILARDLVKLYPGATFVTDVKSTGLFASDPALIAAGAKADYWKTGHSHMKRRVKELGALAGHERGRLPRPTADRVGRIPLSVRVDRQQVVSKAVGCEERVWLAEHESDSQVVDDLARRNVHVSQEWSRGGQRLRVDHPNEAGQHVGRSDGLPVVELQSLAEPHNDRGRRLHHPYAALGLCGAARGTPGQP